METNFQLELTVIPISGEFSTCIGSAISMVDDQTQNITSGKEVFTC